MRVPAMKYRKVGVFLPEYQFFPLSTLGIHYLP